MSESRSDYQRYAVVVAVFATVLYLALLVAAFGIASILFDRDVVNTPGISPVVGPAMAGTSILVLIIALVALAMRVPQERVRVSVPLSLVLGFAAYFFFSATYGLLVGAGRGNPLGFVVALGGQLASPFAVLAGVLAAIVVFLYLIVLSSRRDGGRPRWPWESPDEP